MRKSQYDVRSCIPKERVLEFVFAISICKVSWLLYESVDGGAVTKRILREANGKH